MAEIRTATGEIKPLGPTISVPIYKQQPIYKETFDEAGFNKFVEQKQGEFYNIETEQTEKERKNLSLREKLSEAKRFKAKLIEKESSKEQTGRVVSARGRQSKGREKEAQARLEAKLEAEKAKKEKEINEGKSKFIKKELIGYERVYVGQYTAGESSQARRFATEANIYKNAYTKIGGAYVKGTYDVNKNQFIPAKGTKGLIQKEPYNIKPENVTVDAKFAEAENRATNIANMQRENQASVAKLQKEIKESEFKQTTKGILENMVRSDLASLSKVKSPVSEKLIVPEAKNLFLEARKDKNVLEETTKLRESYFGAREEAGSVVGVKVGENLFEKQKRSTAGKKLIDDAIVSYANRKVEEFNKKYEGASELSEKEFVKYTEEKQKLDKIVTNAKDRLKKRESFDKAFEVASPQSRVLFDIQESTPSVDFAGTPGQKAVIGKPKDFIGGITGLIEERGGKYGTIDFSKQKIKDLPKPRSFSEELEFKKQYGIREAKIAIEKPYDLTNLQKDLGLIGTDVVAGTVTGGVIGTVLPGPGTIAGTISGGLSGAVGGTTDVLTRELLFRETGSELLASSGGTVAGFAAAFASAGPIEKSISKIASRNPRIIGTPKSIAYEVGPDKLRVLRVSEYKTGIKGLSRKFEVLDDFIVSRADLAKDFGIKKADDLFRLAAGKKAPLLLSEKAGQKIKFGVSESKSRALVEFGDEVPDEFIKRISKQSDDLLKNIDIARFEGSQTIRQKTAKDALRELKEKVKPRIYESSLETDTGFGDVLTARSRIMKGKGKTEFYEGVGLSYSQADDSVDDLLKSSRGKKTATKKITDRKLLEFSQADDLVDDIVKGSKSTALAKLEGRISKTTNFGKQARATVFGQEDELTRFISSSKEKGFTKTITQKGDEVITSPAIKYKSETLVFKGPKGKGQITKFDFGEETVDEYLLRIKKLEEKLKNSKIDIGTRAVRQNIKKDFIGIEGPKIEGSEIKQLMEGKAVEKTLVKRSSVPDDKIIGNVLSRMEQGTKSNISSFNKSINRGTGTLTLQKTKTKAGTKSLSSMINKNISRSSGGLAMLQKTKTKTGEKSKTKDTIKQVERQYNKTFVNYRGSQKEDSRFKTGTPIRTKSLEKQGQGKLESIASRYAELTRVGERQKTGITTNIAEAIKTAEATNIAQVEKIAEIQATPTKEKTLTKTTTKPIFPVVPNIKIRTPKIPIIDYGGNPIRNAKTIKGSRQAYNVSVREKRFGSFTETRVAEGEPLNKAIRKGLRTADKYTQRTVIIKKAGRTNKKDISSVGNLINKFRGPKGKSVLKKYGRITFVEKSKYAIDSRNEKLGIPYKAAELRRQRR